MSHITRKWFDIVSIWNPKYAAIKPLVRQAFTATAVPPPCRRRVAPRAVLCAVLWTCVVTAVNVLSYVIGLLVHRQNMLVAVLWLSKSFCWPLIHVFNTWIRNKDVQALDIYVLRVRLLNHFGQKARWNDFKNVNITVCNFLWRPGLCDQGKIKTPQF